MIFSFVLNRTDKVINYGYALKKINPKELELKKLYVGLNDKKEDPDKNKIMS